MSILVLFLQTKNSKDCSNYLTYIKQLNLDCLIYMREDNNISGFPTKNVHYYKDTFFHFDIISNKLKDYDYLLYFDDNSVLDKNINTYIELSNQILEKDNNIDQVIFNTINEKFTATTIRNINVRIPIVDNNELDDYNTFERITDIILDKSNPYPKTDYTEMNYENYLNKKYPIFNFRLLPSLIRCKKLLLENDLFKNDHFEYIFSQKMEKYDFKSCYLNYDLKQVQNKNVIVNNGDNITIVSAFIKLDIKRSAKRSTQKYDYIEKSKDTLSLNHNMVIYVSSELIDYIQDFRTNLNLIDKTKIIEVSREDLYLLDKIDIIKKNCVKNCKPYDIPEYILAVNTRYNLVKNAIDNNYFNTDLFSWIDFAAGHTVNIPKNFKINYSKADKIRISWIGRIKKSKNIFIYNHKCLGGGVFIGHKNIMIEFIKIHDIEFQKLMNMGYCINDDKLLFLIYEKYPHLFDIYGSSYSDILIKST
jgi:hypothetical protein